MYLQLCQMDEETNEVEIYLARVFKRT